MKMGTMYEGLINGLEAARKKIKKLEAELERLNEFVIPKIKAHKFDEWVKVEKELEELKKKEIPMKALHDENYHYFTCPKCGIDWGYTCEVEEHKYCGNCGQRLEFDTEDWEEEDEE